ncbi:MAG: serine dehydratase subunit alpha family protein [Bacteroidales bacterium]|nr:serine dehydratase subunit alpha family protein [Bacteroidales bacterium]
MEETIRIQLRELLQQEVVLATGCTEPGAVALCAAKACRLLGREPERLRLRLSKNVYKNAMGVGIPGTGMIGLPIAVALAVVHGDPDRGLEVLTLPPDCVEDGKRWLADNAQRIDIGVKDTTDKLYIECTATAGDATATAVIARRHTHFVFLSLNGETLLDTKQSLFQEQDNDDNPQQDNRQQLELTARMVYDYATTTPVEELQFIDETARYNDAASQWGLRGAGLHTGALLMQQAGGDAVHTVVARTVAASDARMDGCPMPVYSNSGSGNQGITCTLPPHYFGQLKGCTPEQVTRALVLSHLMSIYIKRGIGRLSALCGIVNASIGVAAALVYLNGGGYREVCFAIKNMINTLAGMVCDGAKPSCALKMATGIYSAHTCALLAVHGHVVEPTDGLSEACVDCSIRNLGRLGKEGMCNTDDCILDIMTHKK